MKQTGTEHITDGIQRKKGIFQLNDQKDRHYQTKQKDCAISLFDRSLRFPHGSVCIGGCQKEKHDLADKLGVPCGTGMICSAFVKPEQYRCKTVDDRCGYDDRKQGTSRMGKKNG